MTDRLRPLKKLSYGSIRWLIGKIARPRLAGPEAIETSVPDPQYIYVLENR